VRAITFRSVANDYIKAHAPAWRNPKHRAQWRSTLDTYVHPVIGDMPVTDVATAHVMAVLGPIWTIKPETATRVRGRIEAVMDYANGAAEKIRPVGAATWTTCCRHAGRYGP
jgi:hypothetical protein